MNVAERLGRVYSEAHYALYDALEASLDPSSPELLHEVAAGYLDADSVILDVGCRDARHLVRLVTTCGGRGVGVDPLEWHVDQARAVVADAELDARVTIVRGVIEDLAVADDSVDFVWCRDVLSVVDGLRAGLAECARVMKPDARMLVYLSFATELLEPHEAQRINGPLGNIAASMDEANVEAAMAAAGLAVERKHVIGTQWREYEEERDKPVSFDLLRLARLRRQEDAIVARYGQELFDVAQASLHWGPYQFLGKLEPVLYVLRPA